MGWLISDGGDDTLSRGRPDLLLGARRPGLKAQLFLDQPLEKIKRGKKGRRVRREATVDQKPRTRPKAIAARLVQRLLHDGASLGAVEAGIKGRGVESQIDRNPFELRGAHDTRRHQEGVVIRPELVLPQRALRGLGGGH